MKKLSLLFVATIISMASFSQVLKFKTISFDLYKFNNELTHRDWQPTEVLVVADVNNDRIRLYCSVPMTIDITHADKPTDIGDGYTLYKYNGVDQDGKRVIVKLSQNETVIPAWIISIEYSDNIYMYQMNKMPD